MCDVVGENGGAKELYNGGNDGSDGDGDRRESPPSHSSSPPSIPSTPPPTPSTPPPISSTPPPSTPSTPPPTPQERLSVSSFGEGQGKEKQNQEEGKKKHEESDDKATTERDSPSSSVLSERLESTTTEDIPSSNSNSNSNSHKDKGTIEASEVCPLQTSKRMEEDSGEGEAKKESAREQRTEEKNGDRQCEMIHVEKEEFGKEDIEETKMGEEEVEKDEEEVHVKEIMEVETQKENEEEKEKNETKMRVSESDTKDVKEEGFFDATERENQENERRDVLVENKQKLENAENMTKIEKVEITLRIRKEEREEKSFDLREEGKENKHENAEQATYPPDDSPRKEEEITQERVHEKGKVAEQEEEEEEEREEAELEENEEQNKEKEMKNENKHHQGTEVTNKMDAEVMETEVRKDEKEEKGEEKEAQQREKEEEKEEEGVDPFQPKITKDAVTRRSKVTKTVNFLDSEFKRQIENDLSKRHTLNSTSSSISSSSSKSKEEEDEQYLARLEGEVEKSSSSTSSRHWTLGEGNPVYRLSLKLSPTLFNTTDIPGPSQHKEVDKTGFLTKLSGRSFPYIAQWKRRYCVLSKGRLYYYEKEDSKAGDKSNGVIQLEYFDQVAEAGPKECKKATNVFIITSQDRSFFDPGRHLFSADTLPDMKDWIKKLQAALDQIRNNNRPAASTSPSAPSSVKDGGGGGGKRRRDEAAESKEGGKGNQQANNNSSNNNTAKEKKKKKEDLGRGRKSSRVGPSSQTQTSMVEQTSCEVDGGRPSTVTPKGGVMLPGFSSRKDTQTVVMNKQAHRRSGTEEELPETGPTLQHVTKQRVKGPQGRRAPQNRRVAAAAALKKRASSLSALEHQDGTENSDAPWLNRSLDLLGGGDSSPWGRKQAGAAVPSTCLPYKAYNYSSDEDDLDDHSDSFPASASASAMMPPPPPPRSASYGLELRCSSQGGVVLREHQELRRPLADSQGSHGNLVVPRNSSGMWRGPNDERWQGSKTSLTQNGGASPVMDDLDNLLMNQSVQHSSIALDTASDVGSEGSSTCRAADHMQPTPATDHCHHHNHQHHDNNHQNQHQSRKKSHELNRFTKAVRHLQRHVVEIDRAVFTVTGDMAGTRREVETLRDAVAALQTDADTITTTLSNLTQEAITAQQKISFATQNDAPKLRLREKEAEQVQASAREALKEAERARQEQIRSRREYEELVAEMRVALQLFRDKSSVPVPIPDSDSIVDASPVSTPTSVSKSSSGSQLNKGYQSLLSKSSSIISGLTTRHSFTKAVSFADNKDKEKRKSDGTETKSGSLEMTRKHDKKDKKDMNSHASAEGKDRENKSKKDKHTNSLEKKELKHHHQRYKSHPETGHHSGRRHSDERELERKEYGSMDRRERRGRLEGRDKRDHVISPLVLDDIPLADDLSHEHEGKSDAKATSSSGSDAIDAGQQKGYFKQTISISLGQPSSSSVNAHSGVASRSKGLSLSREHQSGELSRSKASTDSSLAASSFTRPGLFLPTLEESPPVSETTSLSSLHQPGSTPGPQARQGTMSTSTKERSTSSSSQGKRGTFAISRQHSSPNIPVQRQNSAPGFPIQRQQSLGTVPESSRLPRQESLISVPEDRPVADRTLPLSPSPSMTYVPLSPTASSSTISDSVRRAARESMELVTGPVLAGSAMQEANAVSTLPVLPSGNQSLEPAATSTLRRTQNTHTDTIGILV